MTDVPHQCRKHCAVVDECEAGGTEIKRLKREIELLILELEEAHIAASDAYHGGFQMGQLAKIRDVRLRGRSK